MSSDAEKKVAEEREGVNGDHVVAGNGQAHWVGVVEKNLEGLHLIGQLFTLNRDATI